jgi:PIN domain nuclease of toxin-antitoxin system
VRALLDTHAFLWWIAGDDRLSRRASRVIADVGNEVFVSAASIWEIAIKGRLGRLSIPGDPGKFIAGQIVENAFRGLPVVAGHALRVWELPDHHHDPFDRMLVAQAQVEGLTLVSRDRHVAMYDVEVLW